MSSCLVEEPGVSQNIGSLFAFFAAEEIRLQENLLTGKIPEAMAGNTNLGAFIVDRFAS